MPAHRSPPRWSPLAKQDLRDIWRYYSDIASPLVADGILRKVTNAANRAAARPLLWRRRDALMPGLRAAIVHPYAVFYRIVDGNVEIVRVLHEHRDFAAIFESKEDDR